MSVTKFKATFHDAVPQLPEVWDFLVSYPTLGSIAELHRGIEWNEPLTIDGVETGNRKKFVRDEWFEGSMHGVPPKASFNVFETPHLKWLSLLPKHQRGNAFTYKWEKPKAIMNMLARSRGPWRIATFPDTEGVTCYQGHIGVWPKSDKYDEWVLSAILNSPLANAFVATREGKTNITLQTLKLMPVPYFTDSQRERLRSLIVSYRKATDSSMMLTIAANSERILMEIDALILDGYRLLPKLEHELLEFFRGHGKDRPTRHYFSDYLPPNCEVYFSLSEHLSAKFKNATAGELLRRTGLG